MCGVGLWGMSQQALALLGLHQSAQRCGYLVYFMKEITVNHKQLLGSVSCFLLPPFSVLPTLASLFSIFVLWGSNIPFLENMFWKTP